MRHRFNRWLFQRAAQILHELRVDGLEVDVSINISATDLYDVEVPELISQALATWNVTPDRLCLEITETSMIDDAAGDSVSAVLGRLRALGLSLSIDDFGTGFSGMSRLKRLAVQEVKIDRSFVVDLLNSSRDREIAASIIDLSHRLGVEVTAEGVEDEQTAGLLADMGCDHIQGFLYSKALPPADFVAWVRARAGIGAGRREYERRLIRINFPGRRLRRIRPVSIDLPAFLPLSRSCTPFANVSSPGSRSSRWW